MNARSVISFQVEAENTNLKNILNPAMVIFGSDLSPANFIKSICCYPRHFVLVSALLASFIVTYYPVINSLINTWRTSEDYSHGFLIFPLFCFIIWIKRKKIIYELPLQPHWLGLFIILISLGVYIIAHFGEIRTLASLSMIVCLAGIFIYILGFQALKELFFPFFLLFFMIPIPSQIYAQLTIPLQLIVTKMSALLSQIIGIPVYRAGNVLETTGLNLQVVEACSGLRSMISLLLLSALFAFFCLQSSIGRFFLFIAGIPLAVFINMIRVTSMLLVWNFFAYDLTHGFIHELFGVILFIIALACLFGLQKGIFFWERRIFSK